MDSYQKRELRLHKIDQVISVEPSSKYEGKMVVTLVLHKVTEPQGRRFFVSEKQANSVLRCADKPVSYCILDHANDKGPRFVFASSDPIWLTNSFINAPPKPYTPKPKSDAPAMSMRMEMQQEEPRRPIYQEPPRSFTEDDLPF
jgi:hypothetical protein